MKAFGVGILIVGFIMGVYGFGFWLYHNHPIVGGLIFIVVVMVVFSAMLGGLVMGEYKHFKESRLTFREYMDS